MAITATTLSSAVLVTDNSIVVASSTGFAAGRIVSVDQERMQIGQGYVSGSTTIPVLRGREGTATQAHATSANAIVELGSDPPGPAPTHVNQWPMIRARTMTSYSAAGAIALPVPGSDVVAILNGTSALAMTLANPTKDMDGDLLIIASNGKAAHTVTYTAGLGNGGSAYDVVTYTTGAQQTTSLIAVNGIWNQLSSPMSGTLTAVSTAIA